MRKASLLAASEGRRQGSIGWIEMGADVEIGLT